MILWFCTCLICSECYFASIFDDTILIGKDMHMPCRGGIKSSLLCQLFQQMMQNTQAINCNSAKAAGVKTMHIPVFEQSHATVDCR